MNKINDRFVLLFVFVIFLGACASNNSQQGYVPESGDYSGSAIFERDSDSFNIESDNKALGGIVNPAVQSLIVQAQEQRASNQYDLASSSLERALRISPYTPQIHLHLGRVRLEQGQANAALQLARKGQSLLRGSESPALSTAFWNLLGDCYSYLGEADKASKAYAQPYS